MVVIEPLIKGVPAGGVDIAPAGLVRLVLVRDPRLAGPHHVPDARQGAGVVPVDEHLGGLLRVLDGVLVAPGGGGEEGPGGLGMLCQKAVVGDENRRVVVEDRVDVLEVEVVEIQAALPGGDAAPAVEDPNGVGLALPQGSGLVHDAVGDEVHPGEVPAVGRDHPLHHGQLRGGVPGGVGVALQPGGAVQALARPGDDARGVVLEQSRHGGYLQGVLPGEGGGHGVLGRHGELHLSGGADGRGPVLRGLDDGDLQPRLLKPAQGPGGVQAGKVGVGGPVQAEGHQSQALLCAALSAAGGQGQRQQQRQGQGPGFFPKTHIQSFLSIFS